MMAEIRSFDFKDGCSLQPNNTCMLCGRISDTGLYSFCYRPILTVVNSLLLGQALRLSFDFTIICMFFLNY